MGKPVPIFNEKPQDAAYRTPLNFLRGRRQAEHRRRNPGLKALSGPAYHSRQTLLDLEETSIRSYATAPAPGRQDRPGHADARDAVYANRRRIKGERGKRLLRSPGEKLERTFAHCYETGGMRRVHLLGRDNIPKRALIHAGFNIGLLMRVSYGLRKPRSGSGVACAPVSAPVQAVQFLGAALGRIVATLRALPPIFGRSPAASAA